jgi:hypothetical protein
VTAVGVGVIAVGVGVTAVGVGVGPAQSESNVSGNWSPSLSSPKESPAKFSPTPPGLHGSVRGTTERFRP